MLTVKETLRFSIIKQFIEGKIAQNEALDHLQIHRSTLWRLCQKVEAEGLISLRHGLKGKSSNNHRPDRLKQLVCELYANDYQPHGFNVRHFYQKAAADFPESIGYSTLIRWFKEQGLRQKTKAGIKHRSRRPRRDAFGMMLQMDTSIHDWLSIGKKYSLVSCIDDATSLICGAKLSATDTTLANMSVLKHVIGNYGLFGCLYVDKSPIFKVTRVGGDGKILQPKFKTAYITQMQKALTELGIELIYAHSPQAKGRIERSFKTFQDRLIPELRKEKITTMAAANEYLEKVFVPEHNRLFALSEKEFPNEFVELKNKNLLDEALSEKYDLTVSNDHIVQSYLAGIKLQILPSKNRLSFAKAKVTVLRNTEGTLKVKYKDQFLNFKTLHSRCISTEN